jgi:hypothetical protein
MGYWQQKEISLKLREARVAARRKKLPEAQWFGKPNSAQDVQKEAWVTNARERRQRGLPVYSHDFPVTPGLF